MDTQNERDEVITFTVRLKEIDNESLVIDVETSRKDSTVLEVVAGAMMEIGIRTAEEEFIKKFSDGSGVELTGETQKRFCAEMFNEHE